jgi:hypothetical protein
MPKAWNGNQWRKSFESFENHSAHEQQYYCDPNTFLELARLKPRFRRIYIFRIYHYRQIPFPSALPSLEWLSLLNHNTLELGRINAKRLQDNWCHLLGLDTTSVNLLVQTWRADEACDVAVIGSVSAVLRDLGL